MSYSIITIKKPVPELLSFKLIIYSIILFKFKQYKTYLKNNLKFEEI